MTQDNNQAHFLADAQTILELHDVYSIDPGQVHSSQRGAMQVDLISTMDGPVIDVEGDDGAISVEIRKGRLSGTIRYGDQVRDLDAEDAVGITDGFVHCVNVAVRDDGTHLYFDGYEIFTSSATWWLADIAVTSITVDPQNVHTIHKVTVWDGNFSDRQAVAAALSSAPFVEFAASQLADRDVERVAQLTEGSIRALFRTRGNGQAGTIMVAGGAGQSTGPNAGVGPNAGTGLGTGEASSFELGIADGNLFVQACRGQSVLFREQAPGHWDDGNVHDVVLTSGRGALRIYVDGAEVLNAPGAFSLARSKTLLGSWSGPV